MNSKPIYLRALELDDLDRIHKWHNDPALYQTLGGAFRPISRAACESWLRKKIAYSTTELNLAICLTTTSQQIGNTYLRNIDWVARHAEAHIFIGDSEQRGKGYGTIARRLLIEYAFEKLGLMRLYVFVLADNQASIRMNEKCGFVLEGRLRKHAFKEGEFKDVIVMGLCA
jgi:RimJ/RimL family protein N-acetyltransferase